MSKAEHARPWLERIEAEAAAPHVERLAALERHIRKVSYGWHNAYHAGTWESCSAPSCSSDRAALATSEPTDATGTEARCRVCGNQRRGMVHDHPWAGGDHPFADPAPSDGTER